MATVLVIYAKDDETFVRERLLGPMPMLGFERWRSLVLPRALKRSPGVAVRDVMAESDAIMVVVSRAALGSPSFREWAALARASVAPLCAVHLDFDASTALVEELTSLPAIPHHVATADSPDALWDMLTATLPPVSAERDGTPGERDTPGERHDAREEETPDRARAARIRWNSEILSRLLRKSVDGQNYTRSEALVSALSRQCATRSRPYPFWRAEADLALLRKSRQFLLIRDYGAAVIASGTRSLNVWRQFAQALIELGELEVASNVLRAMIVEAAPKHPESYEARGLLARVYKQRYLEAPHEPDNEAWLSRSIEAYESVYREDASQVWHGINAVSLRLRASRDTTSPNVSPESGEMPHIIEMATAILRELDRRQRENGGKPLDVWDCATRVEALVALGEIANADRALDVYLAHQEMQAFEVSSTYRQFDEVLQLRDDQRARVLLERLWRAVQRLRAGGVARSAIDRDGVEGREGATRSMLLRVSHPQWEPQGVPDLDIHGRLGTVLSITGSEATVRQLMKDPLVIAVEESRPARQLECHVSVPFINVKPSYGAEGNTFSEDGSGAIVAIIDDGIDVLHRAFINDPGTAEGRSSRIIGIWDQCDLCDDSAKHPPGFNYGRYYGKAEIDEFVSTNEAPYVLRNDGGHGTHVASIAAGCKAGAFAGGVAPGAALLVVISAAAKSIGYSKAHIDALTFIDREATKAAKPVVVNVSQGQNAGAHDGKSALEVAFDNFTGGGRTPGRIVVKSAGNEREKRGHAKLSVLSQSRAKLPWTCHPDDEWRFQRLELWWIAANSFKFQLIAPSGETSGWVSDEQPDVSGEFENGGPYRMQFVKRHVDNGDSLLLVEIGDGVKPLTGGEWALELHSVVLRAGGQIHAWIERGGRTRSEFKKFDSEEMTLSIPGTANSVITVGAIEVGPPIMVGDFSSFGPTRDGREKPDVAAPGVRVEAALGGTLDGVHLASGTSQAAPHVAGAIALVLSRTSRLPQAVPTASQIGSALRQLTKNYSAQFDPGQGYGVVDVESLLAAF